MTESRASKEAQPSLISASLQRGELGLLRLYEVTCEKRYLAPADYFIIRRGAEADCNDIRIKEETGSPETAR